MGARPTQRATARCATCPHKTWGSSFGSTSRETISRSEVGADREGPASARRGSDRPVGVAGTMMIEPTESESLSELNRFCDTLIQIKSEIDKIKSGKFDKIDNPIKNAPHTDLELASNKWIHKYSREEAAYPAKFLKINKFWPPVGRIDNVYGDKNLFCTCPSMDEFKEDAA